MSNLGKLTFEPKTTILYELCDQITEDLSQQARQKNISLSVAGMENIILQADQNMLKTILRNLVSNAIKYTNEGGKIVINANINQDVATISVTDDGVGLSKEDQDKLWDISKSFTTYGTANEKGTGLGLLLCKELVEKHDGKIWVESETGKGSCFRFTLPVSAV